VVELANTREVDMPPIPTRSTLSPWQQVVDGLADDAVEGLSPGPPQRILASVEQRAERGHPAARRFFDATRDMPAFCDLDAYEHGRRLIVGLGTELALVLVTGALVSGYASPSLSGPLLATGRLRSDASQRLYETGQMVHNARAPGGLAPDGIGRRTILQVRLLHATVRLRLEAHGYVGPDGGRAIHQLDMAHTATAFSHKGPTALTQLGIVLTPEERDNMHHFWRVVNHLHGVDLALLPETPEETAQLSDLLDDWRYSLDFTEGAELAHAALKSVAGLPPFFLPYEALGTLARRCMSPAQANAWDLPNHSTWGRLLDGIASGQAALTAVWRVLPTVQRARARANVALYGRTLRYHLGADPSERAFGGIAGEEAWLGPGLEPLHLGRRTA